MRIVVLRATRVLTSGCVKNAEISVLKRRVHPLRKRDSKTGFGRAWENVAPTEMARSELAARFRDQMDWVLPYKALNRDRMGSPQKHRRNKTVAGRRSA